MLNTTKPKILYHIAVDTGASELPNFLRKINIRAQTNGQAKPINKPGIKLRLLKPDNVG